MSSKTSIAYEALLYLQNLKTCKDIWLSDETIIWEINQTYSEVKKIGGIKGFTLNLTNGPKGFGKFRHGITDKYDDANTTGVFK